MAKPLTSIACYTHKALTTIASKASQKALTTINGQLAVINVKTPREAQIPMQEAKSTTNLPTACEARSINDNSHSKAVAKPLTSIACYTHKALTTIASKASQKSLTTINGQLAVINVKTPREAQKTAQEAKRKYPSKKRSAKYPSKKNPTIHAK